jgi:hypothetical protein
MEKFKYDIALSFAGEDRAYVEDVAKCLSGNGIKIFFDTYETVDMWGKDLFVHLDDVYNKLSKYCVMFISKYYKDKIWTNHERMAAQAKVLSSKSNEFILTVRFDDTEIPGIRQSIGYIDGTKYSPFQLCKLIIAKLESENRSILTQNSENYYLPKIKKGYTDLDKKEFIKDSFLHLKNYFKNGLIEVERSFPNIKTDFVEINNSRFIAEVFVSGRITISCTIWYNFGKYSSPGIFYYEGSTENSNTYNDFTHVEEDESGLFFKLGTLHLFTIPHEINTEKAKREDLAKYFWFRFTSKLNY